MSRSSKIRRGSLLVGRKVPPCPKGTCTWCDQGNTHVMRAAEFSADEAIAEFERDGGDV